MAEGRIEQSDVTANDIYGLATESLKKFGKAVDEGNKKLSDQADYFERITKSINTLSKKGIDQLTTANRNLTKIVSQANANDKERMQIMQSEAKLRAKLDATIKGERDELIKLQEENRRATKAKRDSVKATLDQSNAYEKLKRETQESQYALKLAIATYGKGSAEARKAQRSFDILEKKLSAVNVAARDGRPFIGRYERAWRGARSTLMRVAGTLGLVGGGFAIFRKVQTTIVGFDQSMQNLAAITKESTTQLEAQARQLGGSTVFTASEAADAMTMLAMAGFNTNQILAATPATLALASAGQLDLAQAADIASNVLSGFGLEAEETTRVVDVLAATATSTNTTVQTLGESFKEIAPTAHNLGIPIEEVAAAVGLLGNSGIKGTDATTTLNSALNRLSNPTKEMTVKMEQLNLEFFNSQGEFIGLTNTVEMLNDRFVGLTDKQRANAISVIFGARANKQMTSLLLGQTKAMVDGTEQTLKGADALRSLTAEYENAEGSAEEMAKTQEDSVGGAFKLLNSALEEYILGVNEATGFSEGLKNTFKFLAENLSVIIDFIGRLTLAFATYKTAMFALKMKDRISEWISFRKEVKKGASNMNDASKSTKGFGQALKGIGFAAAINLAIELAKAFYDVASGARQARYDAEQLERQLGVVNKVVDQDIELRQKELQQKLELAKTDKERLELQEQFNKTNRIKASALEKELEKERRKLKLYEGQKKILDDLNESTGGYARTLLESADQAADLFTNYEDIDDQYTKQLAKVKALESGVKKYNTTISDTSHELRVMTKDTQENTDSKDKNTKATKEQEQSYKDLTESILAAAEAERERLGLIEEFNISESEKGTQSAIDAAKKAAEETGRIEDGRIDAAIKREEELKKARIERLFLERVEEAENAEQVALAMEQRNQEIQILDEEMHNKRKETLDELEAAQEQYSNNLVEIEKERVQREIEAAKVAAEKQKQIRKELFDSLENLADQEIDNMIERSKKKQDILNQEKDAIEKNMDLLRDAANSQNAIASQSLAALEQQQVEKVRQLEEEAEKEAALEELKAAWSALNSFIDQGDNFASATAKALTGVATFKQTLSSIIPFFAKGTKDAPEGLAVTDEQGAEMHLDKYGNIKDFGSDDGARVKYLERGDKILTASETKARQTEMINRQLSGAAIMQSIAMNSKQKGDETLILEMRQLRKTIESKPEYSLHPLIKDGLLVGLKETKKTGSKIEHFRTLKRS